MIIENIIYLISFIITTGIAVISLYISFNLFRENNKTVIQILLFQQLFLFSFFIFSIWGSHTIQLMINDLNLSKELVGKLSVVLPVLGIPFLFLSWFMLLKFGFNFNGFFPSKKMSYIFIVIFTIGVPLISFLLHNKVLQLALNPVIYLVRFFLVINFFIHLLFLFTFINSKQQITILKKHIMLNCIVVYTLGVFAYSLAIWFIEFFNYISINLSLILLFFVSSFPPIIFKILVRRTIDNKTEKAKNNFQYFCEKYEISNREAEIIREICSGKTNKAIAEKLFITLQTVKDHTHRIYTKVQVKNRVQLTNLVQQQID